MYSKIVAHTHKFIHIVHWLNLGRVSYWLWFGYLPSDKNNRGSTFALSPGLTPTMVSLRPLEKLEGLFPLNVSSRVSLRRFYKCRTFSMTLQHHSVRFALTDTVFQTVRANSLKTTWTNSNKLTINRQVVLINHQRKAIALDQDQNYHHLQFGQQKTFSSTKLVSTGEIWLQIFIKIRLHHGFIS